MFGFRAQETSTSTGAANITLAGVSSSDFVTLNTAVGQDALFPYLIKHNSNNTWERGIGYLSAAATLVRTKVTGNSSGTTTAISFASGGLTIGIIFSPDSVFNNPLTGFKRNSGPGLWPDFVRFDAASSRAMVADRLYAGRWISLAGGVVDQAHIDCRTADAGSEVKMAMYRYDRNGDPANIVASCKTNTFDTSSTGVIIASLDEGEIYIPPGDYFIAWVSDGAPSLYSLDPSENPFGHFNGEIPTDNLGTTRACYVNSHTFATALPDPLTGITWAESSSLGHPFVAFSKA